MQTNSQDFPSEGKGPNATTLTQRSISASRMKQEAHGITYEGILVKNV